MAVLDLSNNDLGDKTSAELIEILNALPSSVTSLNLSSNNLNKRSKDDLIAILRALPKNINSLNLSSNQLGERNSQELVEIFKYIPKSVASLMLGRNGFGKKSSGELVAILNELPKNLSSLDLRHNNLRDKNSSEWLEIFNALPKTLSSLDLSGNEFVKKTSNELINFFISLPSHIHNIQLDDSLFNVDDFLLAQSENSAATQRAVERLLTVIQQPLTDENCSFAEILYTDFSSFPIEIDARKKALMINELLALNTPWALVAAALIQQERVPVFYEEDATPVAQSNAHAEICAFSAISYYIQALHHPNADDHIKTFCWGRLWHMLHEYPEGSVFTTANDFIRNNSSSAELYLTKLFPTYTVMRHDFDKPQEEIKTEPMLQTTELSLPQRFFYQKHEKPAPCEQALKKFEKLSVPRAG